MRKQTFLLLLFFCVVGCNSSTEKEITLRFNSSGEFKIAQFTDIHWGENASCKEENIAIIENIIETEKPDFMVLTGDIVWHSPAKAGWESIANIFSSAKIPWAVLMGNHDPELEMTRLEIYSFLDTQSYYVGEIGPDDIHGTGNFTLPIESSDGSKTAATLYCLDSNDYSKNQQKYGYYDLIYFDQIEWYRNKSKEITSKNSGSPLPSLAFFHIPLPEYSELIATGKYLGANNEKKVCSSEVNSGFFCSILDMGDVMGTFVGHDHDNSFIGVKNGVALAYGRVSGLNTYGELTRGARIIKMYEDKFQFDTWIRTNEGEEELFHYPIAITSDEEEASTTSMVVN